MWCIPKSLNTPRRAQFVSFPCWFAFFNSFVSKSEFYKSENWALIFYFVDDTVFRSVQTVVQNLLASDLHMNVFPNNELWLVQELISCRTENASPARLRLYSFAFISAGVLSGRFSIWPRLQVFTGFKVVFVRVKTRIGIFSFSSALEELRNNNFINVLQKHYYQR